MRKSLILLVLVLALSACGIAYAHGAVNATRAEVTLTETTLLGDRSAAQDLLIDLRTQCQDHLFWNTTLQPGQLPSTEFLFSQPEVRETQGYTPGSGVDAYLQTNMGTGSSGGLELTDAETGGLAKVFEDVASRAESGATYSETISLRDYYDVYPLSFDLRLPGKYYSWMELLWQLEDASPDDLLPKNSFAGLKKLADYFSFPILENHRLDVTVVKDAAGIITEINSVATEGSDVSLRSFSATANGSCYFAVCAMTQEHELLDYSRVPGGYGIYRLPCGTEETPLSEIVDGLELFYPLAHTEELIWLQQSADETKLFLVTQEENEYILKVLDTQTAKLLQRIPLLEAGESRWMSDFFIGEDFLAIFFDDRDFVVLSQVPGGDYVWEYSGTLPEPELFAFNRMYNSVIAFDGKRLAVAAMARDRALCGFSLAVCDRTGVLYAGRYDSSLDKGQPEDYHDRCKPLDYSPLQIRWN